MIKKKSKTLGVSFDGGQPPAADFVTEHPLFPVNDDVDPEALAARQIAFIYVYRDGTLAPDVFRHGDIVSTVDLKERFGGGTFTLKARGPNNARWTAQAQISLPGVKKPLDATGECAPPPPTTHASPPAYPYPYPPATNWPELILGLLTACTPIITQWFTRKDEEIALRRAELSENTKLMLSLVQGQTQRADALVSRLLDKNTALGAEDISALIEKFKTQGAQSGDANIQGTISQLVDGLQAFADLQGAKAQQMAIQAGMQPPPYPGTQPPHPGPPSGAP